MKKGTKEYNESLPKCSICLFPIGKQKYTSLCKHSYHYRCIFKWVLIGDTCPICRAPIREPILEEDEEEIILTEAEFQFMRSSYFFLAHRREQQYP